MYSIQITEVFEDWFTGLKDRMVKVRIQARIDPTSKLTLQPRWFRQSNFRRAV